MKMVSDAGIQKRLVIVGRLLPDIRQLVVTREKVEEIGSTLLDTIDVVDVIFLLVVAFCIVPLARLFHRVWFAREYESDKKSESGDEEKPADSFKSTYTYQVAHNVSQIAKIAIIVYVIDCIMVVNYVQGIEFAMTKGVDFGAKIARILYTVWIAYRFMQLKRYLLGRTVNKSPEKLGKIMIFDRILDAIIYAVLTFSIMDTVEIEYGAGLKSLFAFGGLGTLVLSLASKDMATLLVSGLVLSTSEKFHEGDFIELGDKTTGTVVGRGLLYTSIRRKYSDWCESVRLLLFMVRSSVRDESLSMSGGDEHVVKIPNTQLASQRVSNLSRMKTCQVTQTLRFHYSDLDKAPQIICKIKEEIEAMCPELIKDCSRPFRCTLTEFAEDHFEVVVDTRHKLPPIGTKYWENRERVLTAIAIAVAKNNVKFAIPERRILNGENRGVAK